MPLATTRKTVSCPTEVEGGFHIDGEDIWTGGRFDPGVDVVHGDDVVLHLHIFKPINTLIILMKSFVDHSYATVTNNFSHTLCSPIGDDHSKVSR